MLPAQLGRSMRLPDPLAWQSLATQPAVGVALTLAAFLVALRLHRLGRSHPVLNPTMLAIVMVASVVKLSGVGYGAYAQSASLVGFMLAPAVVLLAVPLYRQRHLIRNWIWPIAAALAVGMPTGIASAVGIAWFMGADRQTLLSLAPKSTTAGIAIGISERIGGVPALTAVLVIMTGIVGAVAGPLLAKALAVRDQRAIGLAMGIASHGIGTARALQISELAGAFAGLGMSLNGILTAILLPLTLNLL